MKRKVSLGDPPTIHAGKLRKAIQHYRRSAEVALEAAQSKECLFAAENFENAHRMRGQVEVHMDSLGSKRRFASRKINLTPIARTMVAVRRALETHCGREKAVRG
jgi:hypothetical protein